MGSLFVANRPHVLASRGTAAGGQSQCSKARCPQEVEHERQEERQADVRDVKMGNAETSPFATSCHCEIPGGGHAKNPKLFLPRCVGKACVNSNQEDLSTEARLQLVNGVVVQ